MLCFFARFNHCSFQPVKVTFYPICMHLCKLYICKEQLNKYINIKSIIPTTVFIEGPLYLRVLTPLNFE